MRLTFVDNTFWVVFIFLDIRFNISGWGLYLASLSVRYFPKATVYGLTSTLLLVPDQAGRWPTNIKYAYVQILETYSKHIKEQILKLEGATAGRLSFDKYLKYDKLDTWFYRKIVVHSQEQDRRSYNGH